MLNIGSGNYGGLDYNENMKKCKFYKPFCVMINNVFINGKQPEKISFAKKALNIDEQVALLESRGLVFGDKMAAKEQLIKNSYYRLSGYARLFYKNNKHDFVDGTTFKHITELYYFDGDLKLLLLEALEMIEISFKTTMINNLSVEYGPHWFMQEKYFISPEAHKNTIKIIDSILDKNKKDNVFVKHYNQKYSTPKYPPSWMLFQLFPFGDTGNIYKSLTKSNQAKVSSQYLLHRSNLESRVDCLSYLRNLCAHSDRVWNRTMTKKVNIKDFETYFPKENDGTPVIDTLFSYIIIIVYFLNHILKNIQWLEKFKKLLSSHSKVDINRMGFPNDWEKKIDAFLWELKSQLDEKEKNDVSKSKKK